MKISAHVSSAGGISKAIDRGPGTDKKGSDREQLDRANDIRARVGAN